MFSMTTRLAATVVLCAAMTASASFAEDNSDLQLILVQTAAGIGVDTTAQVLYFSDRPDRVAGHLTKAGQLDEWKQGANKFGEDTPNATLSVFEPGQSEETTVFIEIMQPEVVGRDISYS